MMILLTLLRVYTVYASGRTSSIDNQNCQRCPNPKTNNISDPNNYRPISLLPLISKRLERYIHNHLLPHLDSNNLIYQYQSGFRHKHSCHSALARLCDGWLSAINSSKIVATIFLDFNKASDLLDHSIFLKKLSYYLKDSSSISFLHLYLTNGTRCFSQQRFLI